MAESLLGFFVQRWGSGEKLKTTFDDVNLWHVPHLHIDSIAGSLPVSGTVAATQSGTWTVQQGGSPWSVTVSGSVAVTGTFWQATQPVSIATMPTTAVTGPLTDAELRATPVPVSGTVTANISGSIANTTFAATQSGAWSTGRTWTLASGTDSVAVSGSVGVTGSVAVTGTFYQATQPVSIASMPSTPVTGTFWQATQPVSGTFWQTTQPVSIASMPSTPVTGTFWQATQPVSGTVTATGPLTDTELRATPVPVSASTSTSYGKTVTYVSIAQGAAGTTVLAVASGAAKHKILGCAITMSAAGTLKFNDGTVDLSGAMDIAASGGFVIPTGIIPISETAAVNRPLNLITTGGAAKGFIAILTEA